MTEEQFDELSQRGLFIFGSARSGTSILHDCLNLSPDIFLLYEANFFDKGNQPKFAAAYEEERLALGRHYGKGTFVPPSNNPDEDCLEAMARMGRHHKYVGDKIVFSPANLHQRNQFLQFQAQYFFYSTYIVLMRDPVETAWSMSKLGLGWDIRECLVGWLQLMRLSIDVFRAFQKTLMVCWEKTNDETVRRLATELQVGLQLPQGTIRQSQRKSSLDAGQIPLDMKSIEVYCQRARAMYAPLRDAFSDETFAYIGTESQFDFLHKNYYALRQFEFVVEHFAADTTHAAEALEAHDLIAAHKSGEAMLILDQMGAASDLAPFEEFWVRFTRAKLRASQGDRSGAISDLERALEIRPQHPEATMHWNRNQP